MSLTYGTVLTEGFGWAPATVGLVNVSWDSNGKRFDSADHGTQCGILPASLIAMFWAGWLGDKTNLWLAKRRGGIHLPEDSLVSLILPTIVSGIGIVIYALATNNPQKYSSWGVVMGKWL